MKSQRLLGTNTSKVPPFKPGPMPQWSMERQNVQAQYHCRRIAAQLRPRVSAPLGGHFGPASHDFERNVCLATPWLA